MRNEPTCTNHRGRSSANNNNDSFGVAATIYNRTQGVSGYTGPGFGLSPLGAATAPGQFEAYGANKLGTPTPYQQQLADSLENGTFTSMGNPGNATFYNGAGGNSYAAYGSGSNNNYGAGSNIYSDQFGKAPSSNFVLPQAGAPSSTNDPDTNMFDGQAGISHGSDAFSTEGGAGASSLGDGVGDSVTTGNRPL